MIKKIIPYILILIIFVGFLSPTNKVRAGNATDYDLCIAASGGGDPSGCKGKQGDPNITSSSITSKGKQSPFQDEINRKKCGMFGEDSSISGCVLWIFYALYYALPAFFLWLVAYVFNVLIYVSLGSSLFKDSFVIEAWGVVRDLSNIFFIFMLLYVAIEMILGIGHNVQKTIAKVIIAALLINFSMFFTGVVIDGSNILALVFYNKMTTLTKDSNGKSIDYIAVSGENDVAGAMVANFDPTTTMSPEFLSALKQSFAKKNTAFEKVKTEGEIPIPLLIAILIFSGSLLYYVAIVLSIASVAFLIRIIELWVLIIFSPFAFMSSSIPKLAGREWIGWDDWSKRLIKTSFMAPIFMFFLYFIFKLIKSNIFKSIVSTTSLDPNKLNAASVITYLLGILLPLVFVEVLLYKATKYAISSSGAIGEAIMTGMKALGGIALGAATGGAGLALTSTLGKASSSMASNNNLQKAAEAKGLKGWGAKLALKAGNYGSKASFDIGQSSLGKTFSKNTGINLSNKFIPNNEGGFQGKVARKEKKLEEESALLKTKKSDKEVQEWSKNRQDIYDRAKVEAQFKQGAKFDENEYIKKNGERPKLVTSADAENNERMVAFVNNLPQNGLLGALSYHIAKGNLVDEKNYKDSKKYKNWEDKKTKAETSARSKERGNFNQERFDRMFKTENPEPTVKSINDSEIRKTKMIVGAALGGVAGGGIAGVLAGGYAGSTSGAQQAAESKFAKGIEKETTAIERAAARIDEMKDILLNQTEVLKNVGPSIAKETGGKDSEGNKLYKIDTQKLSDQIAELTAIEQEKKSELDALSRKIIEPGINGTLKRDLEAQRVTIRGEMIGVTTKLNTFNSLKGIEQSMADKRNQIDGLKGKKADLNKPPAPKP